MGLTVVVFQALVAFALAGPLEPRQGIDTSLVDVVPSPTTVSIPIGPTADTTSYNMTEATISATESPLPVMTEPTTTRGIVPRQTACQPNPTGDGPVPTPDTASAFLSLEAFGTIASAAPIPSGYNETFMNLQNRSEAYGYLGFITIDSYDSAGCGVQCDTVFNGCLGFNIFFERDPIVAPAPGCANPPSTTNIKCVFWGGDVTALSATINGSTLVQFQVAYAGSNGYTRTAVPDVPGYDGEPTGNNTVDAPDPDTNITTTTMSTTSTSSSSSSSSTASTTSGSTTTTTGSTSTGSSSMTTTTTTSSSMTSSSSSSSSTPTSTSTPPPPPPPGGPPGGPRGGGRGGTYIGSKIFTGVPFDPALCAAACDAQNTNNLSRPPRFGRPQICRFFTTYIIYRDGQPIGQYCALYTTYYSRSFATNSVSTYQTSLP